MLNDTGIGDIVGSVVDYRVALIIGRILYAGLERDCTPIQLSKLVGEEFVYSSSIYKFISIALPIMVLAIEEVNIGLCFYAFKKSID